MTNRFAALCCLLFLGLAFALEGCQDSDGREGASGGDNDDDNDDNNDNNNDSSNNDDDDDSSSTDGDSDVDGDSDADADVVEDCSTCGYPVAQEYDWRVNSVVYAAEFPAVYNGSPTTLKMQDVHCNSDKVKSLAFIFGRPG